MKNHQWLSKSVVVVVVVVVVAVVVVVVVVVVEVVVGIFPHFIQLVCSIGDRF